MKYVFAIIILFISSTPLAQEPETEKEFHTLVEQAYSFDPLKLDQNGIEEKSKELDKFWAFVRSNPEKYLPLLRAELERIGKPEFFYFDASQLLLSSSKGKDDIRIAAAAIPRSNPRSITPADYVKVVAWLASQGADTREAALRILDDPEFKAFFPEHSLMLGTDYSLIYMLFPMREDVFLSTLVDRIKIERDNKAQKAILLALWYTVTPEGSKAISDFIASDTGTSEAKNYAGSLLSRKYPSSTKPKTTEQELRNSRRKVMSASISDEALEEFEKLTRQLQALRE